MRLVRTDNAVSNAGFALVMTLVFLSLCALLALDAFTRAQLDALLARHQVAARRADLAAFSLLEALEADLDEALRNRRPFPDMRTICLPAAPCEDGYPRITSLIGQLPEGLAARIVLTAAPDDSLSRIGEARVSSVDLYETQAIEARVQVTGSAQASVAARYLLVGRPMSAPGPIR